MINIGKADNIYSTKLGKKDKGGNTCRMDYMTNQPSVIRLSS